MNHFSIQSKLIVSIISLLFFSLSLFSAFILYINYQNRTSTLLEQSKLQSRLIADYVVTPLLFSDVPGAKEVLSKLSSIPTINASAVYDEKGRLFTSYTKKGFHKEPALQMTLFKDSEQFMKDEIIISTPIRYDGQSFGTALFYVSTTEIPKAFLKYGAILILSITALMLFSLFVIKKIQHYITLPIINLAKTAQEISLTEDYSVRAQKMYADEVGHLYDDFNSMLEKIEQRGRERDEAEAISTNYQAHLERLTNELEVRVNERTLALQESLEHLQNTQMQLVEAEKMSALGNLVAGVAHEVNTPLGISITAASVFQHEIGSIRKHMAENTLSKSALDAFLVTIAEADEILMKNLERAAVLIRNFKKISVDQSSEELRDFELNSYLEEVLSTLRTELRHRAVTINLNLDKEPIIMHSYPGAISQVIINMLQNSLLHAFDLDQEGEISIETRYSKGHAIISFSDNGNGIDPAVMNKIFEPFTTTKRSQGGTGLGMNISYNLITQKLLGTIKVDTAHRKGAAFIIEVPCKVSIKTL